MPVRPSSTAPKTQKRISARQRTAYHEAGHAVLSAAINDAPHYVSILEQEGSLGRAAYWMHGRPELLVQVHLAGYAAEEILTGKRTKDTEKRLGWACLSVGRSSPGLAEGHEGTDEHRAIGELLKMGITTETEKLRQEIDRFIEIAKESLVSVWPSVEAVAKALLKHGEIDRDEFLNVIVDDIYTRVFKVQVKHGIMQTPAAGTSTAP